jgi:hypothetical protein
VSLTPQEEQELERLLLMQEAWERIANPSTPTLFNPKPAQSSAETNQPAESKKKAKPATEQPVRDFIDSICPEGSDKPSGPALGKRSWMR